MGLEPGYPVVRSNDPSRPLTLYDANFTAFGTLSGPTETKVNVVCQQQSADGAHWYKLLNPDHPGNTTSVAYVSATACEVVSSPEPTIPECKSLSGCFRKSAAGAVVVAGVAAAAVRRSRRRK
ncbi:MAG TPA: hypothetical protein VK925_00985 [Jiangellaceae bacterium]|nr:hypothetical protein [Jiangellaceae bacterium]